MKASKAASRRKRVSLIRVEKKTHHAENAVRRKVGGVEDQGSPQPNRPV